MKNDEALRPCVIRQDAGGRVEGFSYHDGKIKSIEFLSGDVVQVEFMSLNGSVSALILGGVDLMSINNLREGNIVSSIFLWEIASIPTHVVRRVIDVFDLELSSSMSEVRRGFLVVVECSYGAELYALVDNVKCMTGEGMA